MPIAGEWRAGGSGGSRADTDPYTGDVLTEIGLAGADDLDQAYRAARDAQPEGGAARRERSEVMAKAALILADRENELIEWLQREAGATRGRAAMELALVRAVTEKASEQADRVNVRTGTGSDIPDKENRVYRKASAWWR